MDEATLVKMKPVDWAKYLSGLEALISGLQRATQHQAGGLESDVDGADLGKKIVAEVRQVVAADRQEIRNVVIEQAKQEVGRRVETALKWYGPEGEAAFATLGQALGAWTEAGSPDAGTRTVEAPAGEITLS